MAKFTASSAVTEYNAGLTLSAVEKNPSVNGTLANEIEKLNSMHEDAYVKAGYKLLFGYEGFSELACLVSVLGWSGTSYGCFYCSGYGEGGTVRNHIAKILQSTEGGVDVVVDGSGFTIYNNSLSNIEVHFFVLFGSITKKDYTKI